MSVCKHPHGHTETHTAMGFSGIHLSTLPPPLFPRETASANRNYAVGGGIFLSDESSSALRQDRQAELPEPGLPHPYLDISASAPPPQRYPYCSFAVMSCLLCSVSDERGSSSEDTQHSARTWRFNRALHRPTATTIQRTNAP